MEKVAGSFKAGGHWLKFGGHWLIKCGPDQIGHARFIVRDYDDYDYAAAKQGGKEVVRGKTLPAVIEAACGAGDFALSGALSVRQVADDAHVASVRVVGDGFDEFLALPPEGEPDEKSVSKKAKGQDPVDAVAKALETGHIRLYSEVEGLGDPDSDVEDAAYPLDDIMVRPETRTVGEVMARIDKKRYVMDPDFQRIFVWDKKKQSRLIESCIMRIPLPMLYVAQRADGRIVVVDGLQRLMTFHHFLKDKLPLTDLGDTHPLEGLRFSQLPVELQERVEDTQLTLNILDKNAPQRAQLDIFERVNSGEPLSRQQMRNALLNGSGTEWLHKMSESKLFLDVTGQSLNTKIMRDREAINRFAGFHILGWQSYDKGDMDDFLARTLEKLNKSSAEDFSALTDSFSQSMRLNYKVFKHHSFRRSLSNPEGNKSAINMSLFDVLSWAFARLDGFNDSDLCEIKDRIIKLVSDEDFLDAITRGTSGTRQVHARFRMVAENLADWMET